MLKLGSATIVLLHGEKRESYNLRRGDIHRVRAGTTAYIINNDNDDQLRIVKLWETVSTPGEVQVKNKVDDFVVTSYSYIDN